MERPSHRIKALSLQTGSRRFAGAGFAVAAQLAFAATLVGGIVVRSNIPPRPDLEISKMKDDEAHTPPPPPVRFERPAMPKASAPDIVIAQESSATAITLEAAQPQGTVAAAQPPPPPARPSVPDRAAAAIAETHTAPPYPTLARRLGAQGKVTLRLSVQADGSVGKAEVVTSSGRPDLDQAAAQWITGHWTYRPAIRGGIPATAQVMAAVDFNLSDAR